MLLLSVSVFLLGKINPCHAITNITQARRNIAAVPGRYHQRGGLAAGAVFGGRPVQRPPQVAMALMDGDVEECVDDCDPENSLCVHGEDPDVNTVAGICLDSDAEQLGLGDVAEYLDREEDVFSEATQRQT